MTRHSFDELIENTSPVRVSASHYSLAPNAYGLDDGYAWASGEAPRFDLPDTPIQARHHLADGGDWPYYIAAKPEPFANSRYAVAGAMRPELREVTLPNYDGNGERPAIRITQDGEPAELTPEQAREALNAGRVLETYCEGDLVAYIFETKEERDDAADAWGESGAEYAARVLQQDHHVRDSDEAESLGAAIAYLAADHAGRGQNRADELTRDEVATWFERHHGEYESAADYWQECAEESTPEDERGPWFGYVNWASYARDRDSDGGMVHHDGRMFATEG